MQASRFQLATKSESRRSKASKHGSTTSFEGRRGRGILRWCLAQTWLVLASVAACGYCRTCSHHCTSTSLFWYSHTIRRLRCVGSLASGPTITSLPQNHVQSAVLEKFAHAQNHSETSPQKWPTANFVDLSAALCSAPAPPAPPRTLTRKICGSTILGVPWGTLFGVLILRGSYYLGVYIGPIFGNRDFCVLGRPLFGSFNT